MAPKPWVDHFNKDHVTLTAGLEEWCLTRDYIANILFLHPCVKEGEPGFIEVCRGRKKSPLLIIATMTSCMTAEAAPGAALNASKGVPSGPAAD